MTVAGPHGVVLVTGTGTAVGKTVTTAAVAVLAAVAGRSVAVVKPVQTGVADDEPGDAEHVARLAGSAVVVQEFARLPEPLAPDLAARRAGVHLEPVEAHAVRVAALSRRHDLVLVEGAGGLLVRLDCAGGTLATLAAALPGARVLVVVAAGLGTLNHSELTVEALHRRGLDVAGLVIGSWPADPGTAEQLNLEALPQVTGVPLLGAIPHGAGNLEPADFAAAAAGWLDPALGGRLVRTCRWEPIRLGA